MVSVICPTYERHDRHELLYLAFSKQSYPNKELLVHDDSAVPSPFFLKLKDDRVTYIHTPYRLSIGAKRNVLASLAKGEVIAHFDDDDFYAPIYLETMVAHLEKADLVKFSKWLAFREVDQTFWEWDTTAVGHQHFAVSGWGDQDHEVDLASWHEDPEKYSEAQIWGYGFSYVYRKSVWEEVPFHDVSFQEDYAFVKEARDRGFSLVHLPDNEHLTIHTLHAQSTSMIYPQKKIEMVDLERQIAEAAAPWITSDFTR